CTSMALQYSKGNNKGIVSLAKEALKHEVYDKEFSGISDMKYKEFANWIGNYGVRAEVYTRLNIRGLYKLLSDGNLVMVSVNPNVRGYKTAEAHQKGGHLVLVIGYDKKMKTLTLHNPSGFVSHSTQENHTISVREFIKYYAGRGIALSTLGK
ncbi:MAG: C39 family peptidase, partial [Candidatus Pacebacteria bacterium]|nr:C39 family peptidase [Candidatus Paceibacterota bacterium]